MADCMRCAFTPACDDVEAKHSFGEGCHNYLDRGTALGNAILDEYAFRLEAAREWLLGMKKGEL